MYSVPTLTLLSVTGKMGPGHLSQLQLQVLSQTRQLYWCLGGWKQQWFLRSTNPLSCVQVAYIQSLWNKRNERMLPSQRFLQTSEKKGSAQTFLPPSTLIIILQDYSFTSLRSLLKCCLIWEKAVLTMILEQELPHCASPSPAALLLYSSGHDKAWSLFACLVLPPPPVECKFHGSKNYPLLLVSSLNHSRRSIETYRKAESFKWIGFPFLARWWPRIFWPHWP